MYLYTSIFIFEKYLAEYTSNYLHFLSFEHGIMGHFHFLFYTCCMLIFVHIFLMYDYWGVLIIFPELWRKIMGR